MALTSTLLVTAGLMASKGSPATAVATPIDLGTATSFSVLGGSAVTNTGPTVISGDLGVSPGTSLTGFTPEMVGGTIHENDEVAAQAQSDLRVAYNNAAGQASDVTLGPEAPAELGGLTLVPGVYTAPSSAQLTGTLTLDAQGDPEAVFVFQIGSTLTTASDSTVLLINGANPCNVFWQVGSSATLGTRTAFVGTIMALTSVTLVTGASIEGRALARNGAVTLDTNRITTPDCSDGGGGTDDVAGDDVADADGTAADADTDGTATDADTDGTDADASDADGTATDADTDGTATDADTDGTDTDASDADGTTADDGTDTTGTADDADADGADAGTAGDSDTAGVDSAASADGEDRRGLFARTAGVLPNAGGPSLVALTAALLLLAAGAWLVHGTRSPVVGRHRR